MTASLAQRDGVWYRPHPADDANRPGGDLRAIRDVNRMFARSGSVEPGDVCLDLGAHIGVFTVRALAAGASHVVAVEPMPANLELFHLNVGEDPRVTLLSGSVTSGLIGRERLYLASETETDPHIMTAVKGRSWIDVDTYSLAELCEEYYPTFVKVDVEGSEYDLDIPAALTPSVQRLFIEWHFRKKGRREQAWDIRQELLDQGFRVCWESNWKGGVWWTEGVYVR